MHLSDLSPYDAPLTRSITAFHKERNRSGSH
jgi:hypothetical protein